ncbi:MAG: hypothetical protein ACR2IE_01690 [Candidatus Sumerlaeaceae bacterium]
MENLTSIRGRGTAHNPKNRFERLEVERDAHPELAPDDEILPPQTEHLRMASRTILTKNDSPDVGFSLSINPYNGCTHGWT